MQDSRLQCGGYPAVCARWTSVATKEKFCCDSQQNKGDLLWNLNNLFLIVAPPLAFVTTRFWEFYLFSLFTLPHFWGFLGRFSCSFSPVLARKISSQHQTSTARLWLVRGNWATPSISRSCWRSPTSTPKPRAEGSSPSAPAKKVRYRFCDAWLFR